MSSIKLSLRKTSVEGNTAIAITNLADWIGSISDDVQDCAMHLDIGLNSPDMEDAYSAAAASAGVRGVLNSAETHLQKTLDMLQTAWERARKASADHQESQDTEQASWQSLNEPPVEARRRK